MITELNENFVQRKHCLSISQSDRTCVHLKINKTDFVFNSIYQEQIKIDGIFYEDPKTMATLLAYYKRHYIYYDGVFGESNHETRKRRSGNHKICCNILECCQFEILQNIISKNQNLSYWHCYIEGK
ncbi:hypothetical protein TSAR_013820 [Trichomalopsis sarcophagae]|uniref:Uncharacterized protein n=1 Tax=Trichomalopsis sarcophagae TaxID=543379 RepID=A0A232FAB3_9HYME|nr:hypothetical protein TSAR_013820 [Trichomalopsis sarcophagae]